MSLSAREAAPALNLGLALRLAGRRLRHHLMVAVATIFGIALGMVVVGAVLTVDNNAQRIAEPAAASGDSAGTGDAPAVRNNRLGDVRFIRQGEPEAARPPLVPTQRGAAGRDPAAAGPAAAEGAEHYQAMRLAVRLTSVFAFLVGAVIVFYTMRFSVAARAKEFSLLLCLGESRRNVAFSLIAEALALGLAGTLLGLALALPAAAQLLDWGISTTGQRPRGGFDIPWFELTAMCAISVAVALLGVLSPIRALYRLRVAEVLQPRFVSDDLAVPDRGVYGFGGGFGWLIPALAAAAYLAARPFLQSWLSVVQFFLFEALFVVLLAAALLWWVRPLLSLTIGAFEWLLRRIWPLETLLSGRHLRYNSRRIVFTVAGITLVFSLVTGLHSVTRSLKDEISRWTGRAISPYAYFLRAGTVEQDDARLKQAAADARLHFFRFSSKTEGPFPARLIKGDDFNPYWTGLGNPPLTPGTVLLSKALARKFDLSPGDTVVVRQDGADHRFEVIGVTDRIGFYAEVAEYVDIKTFALFSDGNPLFADGLERTLGQFGMARTVGGSRRISAERLAALEPYYQAVRRGSGLETWRTREIDKDFLIFDFILLMTIVLAGVGVANAILIQVLARNREFSVLRTVGIDKRQLGRLVLLEGAIIGLVGAAMAAVLGNALGLISIAFLDHFTLFDYRFSLSLWATVAISLLAVITCTIAAIYPARVAIRTSSAESLHYE